VEPVFVAAAWESSRVERRDQHWAVGNLGFQSHPGVATEKCSLMFFNPQINAYELYFI
jgi:hypothetical protein